MKKFLARFKSLPLKTRQLLVLGMTLALAVTLPLFIWAILTQQFDLRKRAATGEPTPKPIGTSVSWQTPYAYFRADNFRIIAEQSESAYFAFMDGLKSRPLDWSSDPIIQNITKKIITTVTPRSTA